MIKSPHQHSTGLQAQVFLAYAADPDLDEEPVQPKHLTARNRTVEALRYLLTQAQISFWECPHFRGSTQAFCGSTQDVEIAISRATEACDTYMLVLSPAALADDLCLQGLLFALSMNKRIIPVMAEPVAIDHLPEPLQTLATVDLRSAQPPLSQTGEGRQIVEMLHHEADYHQAHTQLLIRALQWERHQRDPELLLQGRDLVWYQRWLRGARERSHYGPIYLQGLYVVESTRHNEQPGFNQRLDWVKRWLPK